MPQLERQEGRGRPQYKIDIGRPEEGNYRYVSPREVKAALVQFGLDELRQWVHAAYVSLDGSTIVGVLNVSEESCEGHLIDVKLLQGTLGV